MLSSAMARKGTTDQGQALVEFALVLPVFLLLIFGLVEFGILLNAASELAKYRSLDLASDVEDAVLAGTANRVFRLG